MKFLRTIVIASSLTLAACGMTQEEQAREQTRQDRIAAVRDTLTVGSATYNLVVRSFENGSPVATIDTFAQVRSHSVLQSEGTACLYASRGPLTRIDADYGICSSDTRSFSWSVQRHRVYAKNGQPVLSAPVDPAVEKNE